MGPWGFQKFPWHVWLGENENQMVKSGHFFFSFFLLFFPLTLGFSTSASLFLFDSHSCIWKTFRVRILRLHLFSTDLSSHFQRGDKSCLREGFYLNPILEKLRACHPNNCIQVFARWSSNFIRYYRGQQFKFTPIPSSLKMSLWLSISICLNFHPTIWATIIERSESSLKKKHIKKHAQALIFQHHLWVVFKLLSRSIEILCKSRLNFLPAQS
jgi:hypothetical protein